MERFVEMDFAIGQNCEGLYIKKYQDIPESYLERNRMLRDHSANNTAGEYHQVASIPEVLVDQWLREGFDVYKESPKAIVARLQKEGLTSFLTSKKRI
jgi:hypothetical protein